MNLSKVGPPKSEAAGRFFGYAEQGTFAVAPEGAAFIVSGKRNLPLTVQRKTRNDLECHGEIIVAMGEFKSELSDVPEISKALQSLKPSPGFFLAK